MTAAEEGVLLLCSRLGDSVRPLTTPRFRELGQRVRASAREGDFLREVNRQDLLRLGYDEEQAARIVGLLNRTEQLLSYLSHGEQQKVFPLTRVSADYPEKIRSRMGDSCPPVLFYRGDLSLLRQPSVAVVGSRKLKPENEIFAKTAGRMAAKEGLVLVSGGAAGADMAAQNACLEAGGSCIVFVADLLTRHEPHERVLYLSEDGYDLPFSAPRALSRNHLIHTQGDKVLAAQCTHGSGGTWQGCLDNLKHGWTDVFVFDDGSEGAESLLEQGASPVQILTTIKDLQKPQITLF